MEKSIDLEEKDLKSLGGKRATLRDVGEFGFYLDVDDVGEIYVSCDTFYDSVLMKFRLTPKEIDHEN
jgi:hypothetical protein